MALAKIKQEHKDTFIAFGGGGALTLGQRTDIDRLAVIALESGDKSLLELFEQPMPSLQELKKQQTDADLKKSPVVIKRTEEKK